MHIYVDESGTFLRPPAGRRNLACVGALVVPEARRQELAGRFDRLKRQWDVNGAEVKGSSLVEPEIAAAIELLIRCECLFFVTATEMSVNEDAEVSRYQQSEAAALTADLPPTAHPELIKQVTGLRVTFEGMASQLFVQTVLLTDLLKKVIDLASLHFAMTAPAELAAFHWMIDGKDVTKTKCEAAWELIAGGLIQSRTIASPGLMAAEGDYSHFQKFFTTDQDWPKHLPRPNAKSSRGKIISLSKILHESMTFGDSKSDAGLQLADITTNAFRRAMMGRIQPPGYYRLGEVMIHVGRSPFELHHFSTGAGRPSVDEYTDPHTLIKSRSRFAGEAAGRR